MNKIVRWNIDTWRYFWLKLIHNIIREGSIKFSLAKAWIKSAENVMNPSLTLFDWSIGYTLFHNLYLDLGTKVKLQWEWDWMFSNDVFVTRELYILIENFMRIIRLEIIRTLSPQCKHYAGLLPCITQK